MPAIALQHQHSPTSTLPHRRRFEDYQWKMTCTAKYLMFNKVVQLSMIWQGFGSRMYCIDRLRSIEITSQAIFVVEQARNVRLDIKARSMFVRVSNWQPVTRCRMMEDIKNPARSCIRANGNSRLPTPNRRLEIERKTGGRIGARNSIRACSIRHRLSDTSRPLVLCLHVAHPRPHRSSTSPTNEPNRSARHKSGATSLILCPGKARAFTPESEPCWPA